MTENMMNAAVLDKPFSIHVKEIRKPIPKADEVLIKVHCIGICGSDVHYYEYGKIGPYEVKDPIILGHEMAGEVVSTGKNVHDLSVGDHVAVEPGVTCGRCEYCKSGRYNLCPDVQFMATPPVDGAWCEYVAVRSDFVYKLPDEMSYEEGALLEPLSVGFHAMKRGKAAPGDKLFIQGLGPIGLLTIQSAKLYGVSEIYVSDVVDFRLQKALELGATGVIHASKENVQEKLLDFTNGKGVDLVVETSGNGKAIADTIKMVKRGGRIVFVGLPTKSEIPMDMSTLIDAELDVYGVFRYVNTYQSAIDAIIHSDVDLRQVITDSFSLDQISEAVEKARVEKDKSIKIMIYPNGGHQDESTSC